MFRKTIVCAFVVALAMGTALAGNTAEKEAATTGKQAQQAMADKMQAMKAEMMKCSVCKHMRRTSMSWRP